MKRSNEGFSGTTYGSEDSSGYAPGWDPFATPSAETDASRVEQRGERSRNVLQRVGSKIVELSGMISGGLSRMTEVTAKAGNLLGKIAPGSKAHNVISQANSYAEMGVAGAGMVGNVYDSAQSAWAGRGEIAQGAVQYGMEAGKRVAGAGAQAALEVVAKRTGISVEQGEDGKNKLAVRKLKLAKCVLAMVMSGGSYAAKVGVEAGWAARKAATQGAVGEVKAAKQAGRDMAYDAMTGNNPWAQPGNHVPASPEVTAHATKQAESDPWAAPSAGNYDPWATATATPQYAGSGPNDGW